MSLRTNNNSNNNSVKENSTHSTRKREKNPYKIQTENVQIKAPEKYIRKAREGKKIETGIIPIWSQYFRYIYLVNGILISSLFFRFASTCRFLLGWEKERRRFPFRSIQY